MLASGIKPVFAQEWAIMTVSGGGSNYVNGVYNYWDQYNGKPYYVGGPDNCSIMWTGSAWYINCSGQAGSEYYSNENVSSPELVSIWYTANGINPAPSVSGSVNQEPTLTPTFHPLFPTQTPRPPGDYTCPGYQPIGAGTVTPAADWLLKCAQCITPIPRYIWPTVQVMPTTNWDYGTATPTPTATATPATPGLTMRGYIGTVDSIIPQLQLINRPFTRAIGSSNLYAYGSAGFPVKFGVHQVGHLDNFYLAPNYGGGNFWLTFSSGNYINALGWDIEIIESDIPSLTEGTNLHFNSNTIYSYIIKLGQVGVTLTDINWEIKYNVTINGVNNSGIGAQFYTSAFNGNNQSTYNGFTEVTWYPSEVPIIPLPITSDCSTIPTLEITNPLDNPNFKLPYISVGDGVSVPIGGWTIPTGWLQIFFPNAPDSITLPGINFVFAPIEFGELNIFGMSFDLDFISFVVAGVLLFRIVRS